MRALAAVTAAACLAALLSGCADDPQAGYCAAVKEHQQELTRTLDAGGPRALLAALPVLEDLRDHAPEDIADDWATLTTALTGLRDALRRADVDPAAYDDAHPPAGLSAADRERINAAASEVGSASTRAALAAVDQHARDVCHRPLTL